MNVVRLLQTKIILLSYDLFLGYLIFYQGASLGTQSLIFCMISHCLPKISIRIGFFPHFITITMRQTTLAFAQIWHWSDSGQVPRKRQIQQEGEDPEVVVKLFWRNLARRFHLTLNTAKWTISKFAKLMVSLSIFVRSPWFSWLEVFKNIHIFTSFISSFAWSFKLHIVILFVFVSLAALRGAFITVIVIVIVVVIFIVVVIVIVFVFLLIPLLQLQGEHQRWFIPEKFGDVSIWTSLNVRQQ